MGQTQGNTNAEWLHTASTAERLWPARRTWGPLRQENTVPGQEIFNALHTRGV